MPRGRGASLRRRKPRGVQGQQEQEVPHADAIGRDQQEVQQVRVADSGRQQ